MKPGNVQFRQNAEFIEILYILLTFYRDRGRISKARVLRRITPGAFFFAFPVNLFIFWLYISGESCKMFLMK